MKLLKLLLIAGMALSLNAAKLTGPDDNGRLYNTAYFDTVPEGGSPILGTINYSKRVGTFDWSLLSKDIKNLHSNAKFKISTRIEIPSEITTNEVYLTIGETYNFMYKNDSAYVGLAEGLDPMPTWSGKQDTGVQYALSTKFNDKVHASSDVFLSKLKKDAFGNNYVDLVLEFKILMTTSAVRVPLVPKSFDTLIVPLLSQIKIKVAPKSRTYQSKWIEPKIYVMDE